jgi:hypothetical protein
MNSLDNARIIQSMLRLYLSQTYDSYLRDKNIDVMLASQTLYSS